MPFQTNATNNKATNPLRKKKKGPGHITRPPNAFLVFRSEFWAREKAKTKPVERDHRDISRIVALCWKQMDDAAKKPYFDRAQELKELHKLKYPYYRLTPAPRRPRIVKEKTVNIIAAEERCRKIASTLIATLPHPNAHKIHEPISIPESSATQQYPEPVTKGQSGVTRDNHCFGWERMVGPTLMAPKPVCDESDLRDSN